MNFDENGRRISPHEIFKNKQIYLRSPMEKQSHGLCNGLCIKYKAKKSIFGRYSSGQFRCQTCEIYIKIEGTKDEKGLFCKCCNYRVRGKPRNKTYKEKYAQEKYNVDEPLTVEQSHTLEKQNEIEEEFENEKKGVAVEEEKFDESKKTYSELKDFIEEGMRLQANYQLVMLDELVSNDTRHKGQIAEAIAFWNNKDPSDFEVLKYHMDVIPVYDVLIKREFVKYDSDWNSPVQPVFALNVDLDEFQQTRIQELITERLEQWNKEHGIPDNEFPDADTKNNIDWELHRNTTKTGQISTPKWKQIVEEENNELSQEERKSLKISKSENLERSEGVSAGSKYWIWSVTEENWGKVIQNRVWGSKAITRIIENQVQKGDQIIFYVKGTNQFKGIMKLSSDWQDDSRNLRWSDEIKNQEVIYNSFVELKQVVLGVADIDDLENLEIFQSRPREHRGLVLKGVGGGFPANNCKPIPDRDYDQIKQLLEENPGSGSSANQMYLAKEKIELETKTNRDSSSNEKVNLFLSENGDDVKILNCKVENTEIIQKGQTLSNDELIEKFGVGNMGGIRFSSKNNIIVLCDTKSGHYDDKIDKDFEIIYYTGEGKGDQSLTGGNQRILDANTQNTPMFYFIEVPQEPGQRKRGALDNIYEFVGRVRYTKHVFKNEENVDGVSRQVIKFLLEVEK